MTITVAQLTSWVRESERVAAPGTESGLWGEYVEAMRRIGGTASIEDCDHLVAADEASWWMGAYCAQEAVIAGGYTDAEQYAQLMPSEPQEGDWDWIIERMGGDHDESAAIEGYAAIIERERPDED